VPVLPQQISSIRMQVLVNLELHHGVAMGNTAKQSQASSAA
jgi:hypothetical protein